MRLSKTAKLQIEIDELKEARKYLAQRLELVKVELDTYKKFHEPIHALTEVLTRTTDCVAHVLTDLKAIRKEDKTNA